jgi:hypothetical protein
MCDRVLPERRIEHAVEGLVAAPGVVHQHVEAAVLAAHALEQRLHVVVARVVAAQRDAAAAEPRDLVGGVVDRAGHRRHARHRQDLRVAGGRLRARAAAGDVHDRAGGAKLLRDAAAGTAAGPGDDGDAAGQLARGFGLHDGAPAVMLEQTVAPLQAAVLEEREIARRTNSPGVMPHKARNSLARCAWS